MHGETLKKKNTYFSKPALCSKFFVHQYRWYFTYMPTFLLVNSVYPLHIFHLLLTGILRDSGNENCALLVY